MNKLRIIKRILDQKRTDYLIQKTKKQIGRLSDMLFLGRDSRGQQLNGRTIYRMMNQVVNKKKFLKSMEKHKKNIADK